MPEHSETTRMSAMSELTQRFMAEFSVASGELITAVSVASLLPLDGGWIVTTTTAQGSREVWLVPAIQVATP